MDRSISGIYAIRNLADRRQYIGSSQTVAGRWSLHRSQLRRGVHHCKWLQRAWLKHGEGSFRFELIEEVEIDSLLDRENFHIEAGRKTGGVYNSAPVAGTCRGVKLGPHSAEHRRKIGESQKGKIISDDQRLQISKVHKGKTLSAAQRASISAQLRTRVPSEETRAKLSESARNISDETRAKRSASVAAACTPERRAQLVESGRNISEEGRRKRAESVRLSWIKRRLKSGGESIQPSE